MNQVLPIDIINNALENATFRNVLPSAAQIDGMIFAVAASPEIPMPEQWMPWLVQNSASHLVDKDVDKLADVLMNGLREHLDLMRKGGCALSDEILVPVKSESGFRPRQDLVSWLNGLLQVHRHVEPVWQNAWEHLSRKLNRANEISDSESPEVRLTRCLRLFSTLANVELAMRSRNTTQAQMLQENIISLIKQLPAILVEYTTLAGELAAALPNQFETFAKAPQ